MSEGIAKKFNSDFSVSTTGYSGPSGKDVGKVIIAIKTPKDTVVKELKLIGNRQQITKKILDKSLEFLLSEIKLFIFSDK